MLTTIVGNAPDASMGAAMVSPSFTASCTRWIAFAITAFPAVSRTMFSACNTGTPELIRVPSVRDSRAIAVLLKRGPSSGAFSLSLSSVRRPTSVLPHVLVKTTSTAMPITR